MPQNHLVCKYSSDVHSEPSQTSKMESFVKIDNSFQLLTFFAKCSILDVWHGSECISAHTNPVQTSHVTQLKLNLYIHFLLILSFGEHCFDQLKVSQNHLISVSKYLSEGYSEPCQTSKEESTIAIFAIHFILDVLRGF